MHLSLGWCRVVDSCRRKATTFYQSCNWFRNSPAKSASFLVHILWDIAKKFLGRLRLLVISRHTDVTLEFTEFLNIYTSTHVQKAFPFVDVLAARVCTAMTQETAWCWEGLVWWLPARDCPRGSKKFFELQICTVESPDVLKSCWSGSTFFREAQKSTVRYKGNKRKFL